MNNKGRSDLRALVLERDNFICQKCGVKVLSLEEAKRVPHLHHVHLKKDTPGPDKLEDLTTLCFSCHMKVPRSNRGWQPGPRMAEEKPIVFIRASSLGRELSLSRTAIYRWIRGGIVKATKLPTGRYIISMEEAERLRSILSGKPSNS